MTHIRVIGTYPSDHYEHYGQWNPEMTFECGRRHHDLDNKIYLCKGISRFTGRGGCNSPIGNTEIYAHYQCELCHGCMGVPTSYKHIKEKSNSLKWTGSEFVEIDSFSEEGLIF